MWLCVFGNGFITVWLLVMCVLVFILSSILCTVCIVLSRVCTFIIICVFCISVRNIVTD
jgi:hypothetical protein